MKEIIGALPIWLLTFVAITALIILLERLYISKKPIIIADKKFGPPPADEEVTEVSKKNSPNEYQPFILSQKINGELINHVSHYAASWEHILMNMNANDFFALHSWYNERQRHDLALLCLDIAISRGMATSKNFSFRSASLRKLGRQREARFSANFALELDPRNKDAHYNLAIINKEMGRTLKIDEHLKILMATDDESYRERIKIAFPERYKNKA